MKAVYKLNISLEYGSIIGLFVADDNVINYMIDNAVEISFGEVDGKHSYIEGSLDCHEVKFVSSDENVVKLVEEHDLEVGHNPLNYEVVTVDDDFFGLTVGEYILHKLNNTKPQ